jgi:hypothetical protein
VYRVACEGRDTCEGRDRKTENFSLNDNIKFEMLHHFLATSELRGLHNLKKATTLKQRKEGSLRKVGKECNLSKDAVARAVKAVQNNRTPGVNARPNHLNEEEMEEFICLVTLEVELREEVSYERAGMLVRRFEN